MRRPQFSIKTLLWLMAVVAALLGGIRLGIQIEGKRRDNEPFHVAMDKYAKLRREREEKKKAARAAALGYQYNPHRSTAKTGASSSTASQAPRSGTQE